MILNHFTDDPNKNGKQLLGQSDAHPKSINLDRPDPSKTRNTELERSFSLHTFPQNNPNLSQQKTSCAPARVRPRPSHLRFAAAKRQMRGLGFGRAAYAFERTLPITISAETLLRTLATIAVRYNAKGKLSAPTFVRLFPSTQYRQLLLWICLRQKQTVRAKAEDLSSARARSHPLFAPSHWIGQEHRSVFFFVVV